MEDSYLKVIHLIRADYAPSEVVNEKCGVGQVFPVSTDEAEFSVPEGFLRCDGQFYPVARYPVLARALKGQFNPQVYRRRKLPFVFFRYVLVDFESELGIFRVPDLRFK